jgi:dipeptidyl aminopeptidase/acylaminoacyl peptidase
VRRAALALAAAVPLALFGAPSSTGEQSNRITPDDVVKAIRISDPQISPDGKTVAIVAGRANLTEDRWDTELDFVDIAGKSTRAMTHDRLGVGWVRWSPDGTKIAFLANDSDKKSQVFVMPVNGGEAMQVTHSKTPVRQLAWRPDGAVLAFAAPDETPEKKGEAKYEDAFEVGNNSYLERAAAEPVHLWTVPAAGGDAKRLTSGAWSLPVHAAPAGPPPAIAYTPDGKSILFVRADSPRTGDTQSSRLEMLDVASGAMHPLTHASIEEELPLLSPDGTEVAYSFPRDGKRRNEDSVYVVPTGGSPGAAEGRNVSEDIDHAVTRRAGRRTARHWCSQAPTGPARICGFSR